LREALEAHIGAIHSCALAASRRAVDMVIWPGQK